MCDIMAYKIRVNGKTHTVTSKDTAIMFAIFSVQSGIADRVLGHPNRLRFVSIDYNSLTTIPKYTVWNAHGYTTPIFVCEGNNMDKILYVWTGLGQEKVLRKATKSDIVEAKIFLKE